jgi:hypothetical protein
MIGDFAFLGHLCKTDQSGQTEECEMVVKTKVKRPDPYLAQIISALENYDHMSPKANVQAYRQNSVSVRIRIIDPTFKGKSRAEREEKVWAILERLPKDVVAEISMLLLLTPEEAKNSYGSQEFDDPIPSPIK